MCLGCGARLPKREMLRIVKTTEGEIKTDPTGKLNGRGCYVCGKPECTALLRKKRKLSQSFGCEVPADTYDRISAEINGWLTENGGQNIE